MPDLTALDAANAALQASPTVAKATKNYGAAATAAIHALAGSTQPLPFKVKGMYDFGNIAADWPDIHSYGFNTVLVSAADPAGLAALKASGCRAWATCGYWDDVAGKFSQTDAQALQLAAQAVAACDVQSWYVADEPSYTLANVAAIRARAQLLKQAHPTVETLLAYYDAGSLHQWAGVVDAFALDVYPLRNGVMNTSVIPQLAAAADAFGGRYYGVWQAFGDHQTNYTLPTAAQLKQMIDQWAATKQAGWAAYAWRAVGTPVDQQLQNQPALLAVLKAANG